jgi:1-phosphatidylinositol-3-phosphate 5-kinase
MFYRTTDRRFIFKQISKFEMQSFLKFAPNYFHYLATAATETKLTALAKKFGVFRIRKCALVYSNFNYLPVYRNSVTNAAVKLDVFVMEYLFYERNVKQVYDFKGSLRNR